MKIGKEISKIILKIVKEGHNSINNRLINSMSRIINEFSKLPDSLIPAVGINIAACSKDVKDISEVIAFPGRLRVHEGDILQQVLPQIGASKHLAEVLLSLRSKESNSNSIINLKLPSSAIIPTTVNKVVIGNDELFRITAIIFGWLLLIVLGAALLILFAVLRGVNKSLKKLVNDKKGLHEKSLLPPWLLNLCAWQQ